MVNRTTWMMSFAPIVSAIATAAFAGPFAVPATAPATTTAAAGASTSGVRVYAWFDARQPIVTPMIWVRVDEEWPLAAANRVAAALKSRPAGQRVLFLWHPFPPIDKRDLPKLIARGVRFDDRYYRQFFGRLAELEAPIERIVLDYEDGVSIWHTIGVIPEGPERLRAATNVLNDPAASARLPEEVRRTTPAALCSPFAGRDAYVAWNQWASRELESAIRKSLIDVAAERLGARPRTTNYNDVLPSFPVYDLNGWPLQSAAVGDESSPSCYITPSGGRYVDRRKDPRWNRFIDNLNAVRSAMANGPVVPWVAPPTYDGDARGVRDGNAWLWEQMIRHLRATGVREFLYWNPPYRGRNIVREDARAARVFADAGAKPLASRVHLPEILLDADQVVTGEVVTRYEDFR
ncbi:MAG: hypothetical protein WBD40_21650 [Tepidisphaeraceae bacterium]